MEQYEDDLLKDPDAEIEDDLDEIEDSFEDDKDMELNNDNDEPLVSYLDRKEKDIMGPDFDEDSNDTIMESIYMLEETIYESFLGNIDEDHYEFFFDTSAIDKAVNDFVKKNDIKDHLNIKINKIEDPEEYYKTHTSISEDDKEHNNIYEIKLFKGDIIGNYVFGHSADSKEITKNLNAYENIYSSLIEDSKENNSNIFNGYLKLN